MKEVINLFICAMLFAQVLVGQQRIIIKNDRSDVAVEKEHSAISDVNPQAGGQLFAPSPVVAKQGQESINESLIGTTEYDLQTNRSLSNRLCLFSDGTIGAVWMMGFTDPNFGDRGTGYNYFNGTSWSTPPLIRIESVKTGWPSIAAWGASGEIVVAHNGLATTDGGLIFSKRTQKGSGSWTSSVFQGPDPDWHELLWPRMVTNGVNHNTIHLLSPTAPTGNGGIAYMGQDPALLYSRSTDGGVTWNPKHQILPGTGSTYYSSITADEYTWAEPRGNTLAFLVCDPWKDLFVMKSTDNGDTWQKLVAWTHPYPHFDWNTTITTDTLWAPDGSGDVAIDNNGQVHILCGLTRVAHTEPGTTYSYWPWTDGIAYWNESRPPFTAPNPHDALDADDVLVENYNLVGWTQDVNNNGILDFESELMTYRSLGISTMPNIIIDDQNYLFIVYASTTETYTNGTYNYKHIWARGSDDNGTTWNNFVDLTSDLYHIFDECIYPVYAGQSDDKVYLIYNYDASPGLALDGDHAYQTNNISFFSIDKSDLVAYQPPQGIHVFPYVQSFESGLGEWVQSVDDDFDWTLTNAPTPTVNTGPDQAYEGSYYLFTESSSPNFPNKTAGLYAVFDFSQLDQPGLSFWYHMYGTTMGTLKAQVSVNGGVTWTDLWTKTGDQGNQWLNATVSLTAYMGVGNVRIRFWGITGMSFYSDMAVDDIQVAGISTPPQCTNPVTPQNGAINVSVATDLEWSPVPEATGYILYLGTDDPPGNIVNGEDLGDMTVYDHPVDLDYSTQYFWEIVPYNQYGPATGCQSWSFITEVGSGLPFTLHLKAFLEGPFNSGVMAYLLNFFGYLPLSQPYGTSPWWYNGTESVVQPPDYVVDWVLVELRETTGGPSTALHDSTIARRAGFIRYDGGIVDLDGVSDLGFSVNVSANLYAVVLQRNHLGIMSAVPLTLTGSTYSYDFTTSAVQVYGGSNGHKEVSPGIWAMISGDGNADGQVNNSDKIEVWKVQSGNSGYKSGDFNMDGQVNNPDKIEKWKPNSGRSCQVPQ
jgi:hypothetical protein